MKTASQIWNCFYVGDKVHKIVEYINKFIQSQSYDVTQNHYFLLADLLQVLLYISGASKCSQRNAEDLFRTDGMPMNIFILIKVKKLSQYATLGEKLE